MLKFYLVPVDEYIHPETGALYRGPKYFKWRWNPDGIPCARGSMDYGFFPYMLIVAKDITQADHDALILNSDVFVFPDNLDEPIPPNTVNDFFESINIPTDWLTPSTTYLELLRNTAGMFQFNQRFAGIYAERYNEAHSIFDNADMSTRLRQMTDEEQEIFLATVESFGFPPESVNLNSQLRLLVRQAATYWEGKPFYCGGIEF